MTTQEIRDRYDECKEKFISKASYFKERFTSLVTVVICSIGIVSSIIFSSVKINSEVAVLKTQVNTLKKLLEQQGKISYREDENGFYYVYKGDEK